MSTPTPLVLLKAVNYSGSGTWNDESGSGRNATLGGGVIAKNTEGNAIVLNGSSYWKFSNLSLGNAWTLEGWYKDTGTTQATGVQASIVAQNSANRVNAILGYYNNGTFQGAYYNSTTSWKTTSAVAIPAGFNHYATTWDGSSMSLYLNGLLHNKVTLSGTALDGGTQYLIGCDWVAANFLKGEIGEVRAYGSALTPAQIAADYNSSLSTFYTAPQFTSTTIPGMGLWLDASNPNNFTFSSGNTVSTWLDKSPTALHYTAFGTAATLGYDTTYKQGGVLFGGSAFYPTDLTKTPFAPTNQYTIFTVKRGTNSASSPQEFWRTVSDAPQIEFERYYNGLNLQIGGTGSTSAATTYAGSAGIGSTVSAGTTFAYYLNGTSLLTGSRGTTAKTATANIALGCDGFGRSPAVESFYGYMYEVIIFKSALTTAQRQLVEGYLAWKYNIQTSLPSTHPYYSAVPTYGVAPDPLVLLRAINYSGTGTWNDESGFGRNATKETGVIAKNTAGNGIVLNGSTVWTFPNPALGNAWTASIWFKRTGTQTIMADILSQIYAGGSSMNLVIGHIDSTNTVFGTFFATSAWKKGTGFTLTNGSWTNMQITWNGTNMSTYINGGLIGTTTPGGTAVDIGTAYRIGGDWNVNDSSLIGEIGEVRLYNSALTPFQVDTLYNSTSAVYTAPSPLVLLRGIDYTSGAWLDKSGYARNATLEAGTATKNAAGNALVLNGSTTWTFPNVYAGNAWTASVWFKSVSKATWDTAADILTQIYNTSFVRINLMIGNNTTNVFAAQFLNSSFYTGNTITLTDGVWTNIQATWDGTSIRTYINGTLLGTTTPGGSSLDSGLGYRIGARWDTGGYIKGEIGEVRIYGTPLTQAQVTADYQSGLNTYIATAPTAITAVSYPSLGSSSFTANWTGGYGATSYTYTLNGSAATPSVDSGVASQTVTFTGLNSSTAYSLGITGTNATGNVTYYSSATTLTVLPTAPVVTTSSVTFTSFVASWTGASGASSYTYKLNGVSITPTSENVADKTATFSGLAANTTYSLVVTATNSVGSTASTAVSVTTTYLPPTTIVPTISSVTPSSFVASWSGAVGATSYTYTLNGTAATPSTDNALTSKTVTFTGLTHTTNYTLVINAINGGGTTSVTTSTTTLIPLPTAPVVTVTNLKDTTFTVSYTSTGTSYSYTLNGTSVTPSVSGLTATFSGLTASTNYSLVVNAINSTGSTPTTTAITTMAPPPTVPVVSATSITDTSFVATWTGAVGASSYTYTLNGTAATPSTDNGVAGKSATFTGLTASTSYTLIVTAINSTNPTSSIGTTVNTLIPRPTVPVVTISSVRDTTFVASWTGGATATSYSYTLNGVAATPSINNALASQTVTFTGLQSSTAYTLIVTATNGTGPTPSAGVSATTLIAPPSIPVVTIGSIRDTSFVATWTGGLRATSYTYTLNGSSATPSTDAGLSSQTATFTGLNASTTYTLIVTAINSTNSTTSAGVSMNTLIPPPTKPDSLNITSITNTSFVANWTGGDPATSYTYTLNGTAVTPAIDNGVNSDNATFTGLQPSTTYTLLVTAIDSTGPTTSDPITVTTLPPLPTLPVVTIGTISDTYFMVTWTGGVGATSYTYTLNGNNVRPDIDDCLCGEATFTGLTAETNYSFVVTAVNVTGTTSSVASSLLTLISRPTKPMPTIVLLSDSICSVSWTGGVGATSYSYTLNGEAVTPTIDNGLNGQLTFTGLSANTTYALMVAAINSTGPRYSSPLNFTTLPPAPTLPVVTFSKVTALSFVATWTGGTGATSYTYTLNGTPATPSIDNGLTGKATFTGLIPNTLYSLVVKARNVTATTLSAAAAVTTLTSPTKPTDLSATVTASSFTVSWTGASDVTSYTYLLNGASFTPIDNGVLNQTATFTGLASLITYTCTVIAHNEYGTATSDVLSVRTAATPPQVTSAAVTQLATTLANSNIADPEVAASAITAALATSSSATVISAALSLPSPVLFTALVNNPNLVGATVTIPARAAATLYNNAQDTTNIDRSLPLTVTIPAADGSLPAPAIGRNTKMAIDVTVNTYTPFRGSTGYGVRVINGIQHFVSPGNADVVINVGDVITLLTDSGATLNFTVADLDLFVVPYSPPSIVCFLGSAPVLTPTGYRRIDRIQVGDIVVTPTGTAVVELVKKQSYKPSPASNPYVIPEGKFGANRKLLISPRHKVAVGGKMIEARDLGLEQEAQKGTIIYYNIQITKRQNMIVAGVEVESLAALIRVTISNEEFMKILNTKFGGQLTDEIKAKCRFLGYGVSVPAMI